MDLVLPEKVNRTGFTGHRRMTPNERLAAGEALAEIIPLLAACGAGTFVCGGALGFDTAAELAVLRAKSRGLCVRLELVLPCPDQDRLWQDPDRAVYAEIKKLADSVSVVCPEYRRGCMHMRDRELVRGCDLLVAWLHPEETRGGTLYTVKQAERAGIPVINLMKATGMVYERQ